MLGFVALGLAPSLEVHGKPGRTGYELAARPG